MVPFSQRDGAVLLEDVAAVEVTVLIELVVDRGMGGGEFLQNLYVPVRRAEFVKLAYSQFRSEAGLIAANVAYGSRLPLWVKSGSPAWASECPLI